MVFGEPLLSSEESANALAVFFQALRNTWSSLLEQEWGLGVEDQATRLELGIVRLRQFFFSKRSRRNRRYDEALDSFHIGGRLLEASRRGLSKLIAPPGELEGLKHVWGA